MICTDPIIGYREFIDGICRAIFEDMSGQYSAADDGKECTARTLLLNLVLAARNPKAWAKKAISAEYIKCPPAPL